MIINDFIRGDSSEAMLMISLLHFHKPRRRKLRVAGRNLRQRSVLATSGHIRV